MPVDSYLIKGGRNVAMPGMRTIISRATRSAQTKGMAPLNIFVRGTSGAIDFTVNTLFPIGGVIRASSTTTMTMISTRPSRHLQPGGKGRTPVLSVRVYQYFQIPFPIQCKLLKLAAPDTFVTVQTIA